MKFQKILLLMLAAILLFSCLTACLKRREAGTTTTTHSQEPTVEGTGENPGNGYTYDENGFVKDQLPDLNYNYQNVNMLHWKPYKDEYLLQDGDNLIDSALYSRIASLEERLKCYLTIKYLPGDWENRAEFNNTVFNDVSSGDPQYNIVSQYSFCAPVLTMYGCYQNLNDIEHLNLDMPWWNADVRGSVQIGDKLYFATGDIAPTVIYNTYCMLFNHSTLQNHGRSPDDMYNMVLNLEWTLEELEVLTKDIWEDKNNDGVSNHGDFFGIDVFDHVHYDALAYAAGVRIFDKDQNTGNYVLSPDFVGMKTATLLDDCIRVFHSDSVIVNKNCKSFIEGNSLFALTTFGIVTGALTKATFNYGILPVPMYDASQRGYSTCLAVPYSMYAVPFGSADYSRSGAVMEALASHAYRKVTPAIYEEGLKSRYSRDTMSAQVYDLIRESVVYDIGRLWGEEVKSEADNAFALFRNAVAQKKNWGSLIGSSKGPYVEKLGGIINAINKLDH